MIDAAAGLLLVEGFLQAAHNLGSCYQANSGWNIWLLQGFFYRLYCLVWVNLGLSLLKYD